MTTHFKVLYFFLHNDIMALKARQNGLECPPPPLNQMYLNQNQPMNMNSYAEFLLNSENLDCLKLNLTRYISLIIAIQLFDQFDCLAILILGTIMHEMERALIRDWAFIENNNRNFQITHLLLKENQLKIQIKF